MNAKPVATGGSSALLALLLLCATPAAQAQEARLQIDHLDRLAARATESVEITMNDVQVQFLRKLVTLSESDQSKLKNIVGPMDMGEMALLEREFHVTRCGGSKVGRQRRNTR